MEKEKLEEFRLQLEAMKAEILNNAEQTISKMGDMKAVFADPTDRAELETSRSFDLRIRDRERKLLRKIEEALQRIAAGAFGICEVCGGEIEEARLRARPVTTMCVECKLEEERLEQLRQGKSG